MKRSFHGMRLQAPPLTKQPVSAARCYGVCVKPLGNGRKPVLHFEVVPVRVAKLRAVKEPGGMPPSGGVSPKPVASPTAATRRKRR